MVSKVVVFVIQFADEFILNITVTRNLFDIVIITDQNYLAFFVRPVILFGFNQVPHKVLFFSRVD
jgi:hypothetical protein